MSPVSTLWQILSQFALLDKSHLLSTISSVISRSIKELCCIYRSQKMLSLKHQERPSDQQETLRLNRTTKEVSTTWPIRSDSRSRLYHCSVRSDRGSDPTRKCRKALRLDSWIQKKMFFKLEVLHGFILLLNGLIMDAVLIKNGVNGQFQQIRQWPIDHTWDRLRIVW